MEIFIHVVKEVVFWTLITGCLAMYFWSIFLLRDTENDE